MIKKIIILFLVVLCTFLMVSCATRNSYELIDIGGTLVKWDGNHIIEPPSKLNINKMSFEDFGPFFENVYNVTVEDYVLFNGTFGNVEVRHIHSNNEGNTVYIVSGVHGDEKAGWYAGSLLKNVTISSGDLYIIAPANIRGANENIRDVVEDIDLNRSFNTNFDSLENLNEANLIAKAIYDDIGRVKPNVVLDLHEAILYKVENHDFLGSSFIFSELDGIEDLFFGLLMENADGNLCHNEFGYNGPGPAGSLNASVTYGLKVPVITVETFMGYDIYRRVYDQLDVVQYTLRFYNMCQ
ncbi:MAG: succinylglutamate desuccinylase/aspartoacylase family protein [Sphaerochaetaceae bacterium]|nr:succinylglutamate desuccinylase/aspartoacylase family protein [Sphaerochaetaceae bacterium]